MTNVLDRLRECIAIPSPTPPGDVAAVADWLEGWAKDIGCTVARQQVRHDQDNVLARLSFSPGPTLVFNSHMDVNDPSDQIWSSPPFDPRLAGGRLFGRGACDAKGSLVAMLAAIERLAVNPARLRGSILLTAVMGEEEGGLGSRHLVQAGLEGDAAVVGEPTGLRIARAHKGTYIRRVTFRGRAAHSASPWRGRNAATHAAAFCLACDEVTSRLAGRPHPLVGPATLTVTGVVAGNYQNTVPDRATVTVDRRLVPGHMHTDCDDELADVLRRIVDAYPDSDPAPPEVVVATVPSETPADAAIVATALAATADCGRPQREAVAFPAGCDMSKLVNDAGIPTVICGPGSLTEAHAPDEFVPTDEVTDAVVLYEQLARRYLSATGEDRCG